MLTEVAGAILDGAPIDWVAAESSADEAERELLAPLRLVASWPTFIVAMPIPRRCLPREWTTPRLRCSWSGSS